MIKLKENEVVRRIVRKHWFILFADALVLVFIYALPFVLYTYLAGVSSSLFGAYKTPPSFTDTSMVIFAGALWTLAVWMRFAAIWTDYYLDTWIITNKRVVDIEQIGFFHREISTLPVPRVQDVTIRIRGILATLLDFGEVHVQSAGSAREFVIHGVPNPHEIKELILHEHNTAHRGSRKPHE